MPKSFPKTAKGCLSLLLLSILMWIPLDSANAAQDSQLTLDQAILIALENNFSIKVARNRAEIASLNNNPGAAGFFPDVNFSAGLSGGHESVRITEDGISSPVYGTSRIVSDVDLALNWTIFDGLKMFTTAKKLDEFESLGKVQSRIQIEQTVTEVIRAYYNIVRIEKRLSVLKNTVEISEERFRIADMKRQVGAGSEYEVLLARTDLNSDRAAVIREGVLLNDAKVHLLTLLNLDPSTVFDVIGDISITSPIGLSEVFSGIESDNSVLNSALIQYRIASLERQEVLRGRMPTISLNAGYNINNRETDNSVRRLQEVDGYRYGITLRVPLIDGFNLNRKLQAARIYERNAELILEEQLMRLNAMAVAEYQNYSASRQIIEIETDNLDLAKQTIAIALERFYLGTTTSLELRESQRTLINTETRLISAQYEAKVSETELLRLMGRILAE